MLARLWLLERLLIRLPPLMLLSSVVGLPLAVDADRHGSLTLLSGLARARTWIDGLIRRQDEAFDKRVYPSSLSRQ